MLSEILGIQIQECRGAGLVAECILPVSLSLLSLLIKTPDTSSRARPNPM